MQRQVNNLNAPKIYFFCDSKAHISSITLKHLNRIHRDMDHPDHTQMATECVRLGHKVCLFFVFICIYLRIYFNIVTDDIVIKYII